VLITAMVVAGSLGAAAPAMAAPPPNDDLASAANLGSVSTPGSTAFDAPATADTNTNSEATAQGGEPAHAGSAAENSVWFSWSPTSSGTLRLGLCNPTTNVRFAVYRGGTTFGSLTPVSDNGNVLPFPSNAGGCEQRDYDFTPGTYKLAVDGFSGNTGTFGLRGRVLSPPSNDDFTNRQVITGNLPKVLDAGNVDASSEAGEPDHDDFSFTTSSSVWYSWTATETGEVRIDTCVEPTYTTVVDIYTGTAVGGLTKVSTDFPPICPDFDGVKVSFDAVAGQTYEIAVDRTTPAFPSPDEGSLGIFEGTFRLIMESDASRYLPTPTILGASPPSGQATDPRIFGSASPLADFVFLSTDPSCSAQSDEGGTPSAFASPGFLQSISQDTSKTFWVKAFDNYSHQSNCSSASFTYAGPPGIQAPQPDEPQKKKRKNKKKKKKKKKRR
jgi:hypothetical protein